jgi:hypothetical protein
LDSPTVNALPLIVRKLGKRVWALHTESKDSVDLALLDIFKNTVALNVRVSEACSLTYNLLLDVSMRVSGFTN